MEWDNVYQDGYRYIAYILGDDERKVLIAWMYKQIPKLEKKIDKLKIHPKNDGQVTFSSKIDDLRDQVKEYKEAIETLESHLGSKPK